MPECGRTGDRELDIDRHPSLLTNSGVILGKATEIPPRELMARGPENANPIASLLAREGPFGLLALAQREGGFTPPRRAHSKCSLCYQLRNHLRPSYPDILGPAEVYGLKLTGSPKSRRDGRT